MNPYRASLNSEPVSHTYAAKTSELRYTVTNEIRERRGKLTVLPSVEVVPDVFMDWRELQRSEGKTNAWSVKRTGR